MGLRPTWRSNFRAPTRTYYWAWPGGRCGCSRVCPAHKTRASTRRDHRPNSKSCRIGGSAPRYNVRIDDVTNLIDTALGGQPVGTLYEGDRRFDIVVKLDRADVASPQAIGRLTVHTAEGLPVPLAQVAKINVVDGQTMIARETVGGGLRWLRHRWPR